MGLSPSAALYLDLWYSALGSTSGGIYIRTPDPVRLKSLLYTARARAADPSIAHLQIRTAPNDPRGELWVFNPACVEM